MIFSILKRLPVSRPGKEFIKDLLFGAFPFLLSHLSAYGYWKAARIFMPEIQPLINKTPLRPAPEPAEPVRKLAVICHAYYPEVLGAILDHLGSFPAEIISLYISAPEEKTEEIKSLLAGYPFPYEIRTVENRGRDILPFLEVLKDLWAANPDLILKIHTKKTNRRRKGSEWSDSLYNNLLDAESVNRALAVFSECPGLGMMAPAGHIIPMRFYYGSNAARVKHLGERMGATLQEMQHLDFAAGSMFYARPQAFEPLLQLQLERSDFESETGQEDGTTAHAVERLLALSTAVAGYTLADTKCSVENPTYSLVKDYRFSW